MIEHVCRKADGTVSVGRQRESSRNTLLAVEHCLGGVV